MSQYHQFGTLPISQAQPHAVHLYGDQDHFVIQLGQLFKTSALTTTSLADAQTSTQSALGQAVRRTAAPRPGNVKFIVVP